MNLSNIRQITCFEVILNCQSWLPTTEEPSIPDKIRLIALEKLTSCQEALFKSLQEITAVHIPSCNAQQLIHHLEDLKNFNEGTEIVSNFIKSPMGEILLPKDREVHSKVMERLERNFQTIEKSLSLTLERIAKNSMLFSKKGVLNLEFLEKIFCHRYSCYPFAALYFDLLLENSALQIKDWLKNEPHLQHRLAAFPCNVILKIFNSFHQNLDNESYPLGFTNRNLFLIDYFTKYLSVKDHEAKALLDDIENHLCGFYFSILTRTSTLFLRKIVKFIAGSPKSRKQLIRFLQDDSVEQALALNFKKFKSIVRRLPLIKSKNWLRAITLYRSHKKLFIRLINQKCLRNKSSRIDKCIQIGLSNPSYLKKLIHLMDECNQNKEFIFRRLVKHFSYVQLMKMKPLIEWNFDHSSNPILIKGLHFLVKDPDSFLPLMKLPENKRFLWLILFAKLKEGTLNEIETVFEDHSEFKLFMTLYHPLKVKPFILEIQALIQSKPELEKPFEAWLSKIMTVLKNKKNTHLEYQNRSIALRALEMDKEHIVSFFDYAKTTFYYRHLSHLLYLEKKCKNDFTIIIDFVKKNPEYLYRLNTICHRLGAAITSDLLKAWRDYPEIILKIIENNSLSLNFYEGVILYLRTQTVWVISYIDLNDRHPGLFHRLNQDVHLLSTSFLKHLVQDTIASGHFYCLLQAALPHYSGTLVRTISEAFEKNPKDCLRVLSKTYTAPLSFIFLINMVKQLDSDVAIYLNCLEKQPFPVTHKITYLMENFEHRELAKTLCQLLMTESSHLNALKFLDLAMEGYVREATELANRYQCFQFSSLNTFLYNIAGSQHGSIIKKILNSDAITRKEIIDQLEEEKEHDFLFVQTICHRRYLLLEFLRNCCSGSSLQSGSHHHTVLEEVKKGNWLTAEWLVHNQQDCSKHDRNFIHALLQNASNRDFYNAEEKQEALEVALSVGIALSIMSPKGIINRAQIPKIRESILSQNLIPSKTDAVAHVLHVLNLLEKDEEDICIKFQLFEKRVKSLKPPIQQILKQFLEHEEINDLRYCVLSALLMRPRQNNYLGNCFASQLFIQTSYTAKGLSRAVEDYFEILTFGSLNRLDPVRKVFVEYKLPENATYLQTSYPAEHPLQRARENLLTQMGSEVFSQRLHRQNMDLLHPKTRHNYLFRVLEQAKIENQKSLFHVAKCLQQSIKDLSDVSYEAFAIDPHSKTPGAWRLIQKEPKKIIYSFEEYVEFLRHAIEHSLTGVDSDGKKMLDHLKHYLSDSSYFQKKLESYYRKKKKALHSTHWLDYSGGIAEGVRLRYYNLDCSHTLNKSYFILNAEDALRCTYAFSDLLSSRIRSKINVEKEFRIPIDYPHHCANLILYEIRQHTVENLIETLLSDVQSARNLALAKSLYEFLIDLFREKIPVHDADGWAHLVYSKIQNITTLGQFCDTCMEALQQLCIPEQKQVVILAGWENLLRSHLPRSIPNILKLIDTNWKDHPFNNVYLGIGGSIFHQKLIFFRSKNDTYLALKVDYATGQWDFNIPIHL